jgi:alkanesulfonate monooxygenase SsuD/methylene tetrahydromethanopterin reductase-like flavin-dependent oxidoreductase (luciferase family)
MPCRNVVPKPFQKPHPPLWVAGKPDLAARHGMGCLGFNAMSGDQARAAVKLYYDKLASDCVPIGHTVNPNIAILAPMHVHRDGLIARERAEHLKFFAFSVAEYYLTGEVKPGRQRSWDRFQQIKDQIPALGADNPTAAVGSVEEVREHVRMLEEAGVDQILLLHQAGKLPHEQNCESLELFAREIMTEFQDRDAERERRKTQRLAPVVDAAMARKEWRRELGEDEIPAVVPYGSASFIPTPDAPAPAGISEATKGALGLVG